MLGLNKQGITNISRHICGCQRFHFYRPQDWDYIYVMGVSDMISKYFLPDHIGHFSLLPASKDSDAYAHGFSAWNTISFANNAWPA